MTRPLPAARRRQISLAVVVAAAVFVRWALQTVTPPCVSLSSEPYGSTFRGAKTQAHEAAAGRCGAPGHARFRDWISW
ncbi:hypothetical protein ACIQVT_19505 [Streptomyces sp. NPDC100445]|uniref:hypothetical protein n=1 Tax=Streptomyces sp. NPDC100445 TaxID=3366102 RepID=UPI0038154A2E